MLGFSEIIRDEMLGTNGQPAYRDYAADIHTSGRRLLAIINDVLDVSRLEGGLLTIDARLTGPQDTPSRRFRWHASTTGENRVYRHCHAGQFAGGAG